MLVKMKLEGGFAYLPGITNCVKTVDTDDLPKPEAQTLRRLVKSANFFDLPKQVGANPRRAVDSHRYTITVEDDDRVHTVKAVEPVEDRKLSMLVDYLQQLGLDNDHDEDD